MSGMSSVIDGVLEAIAINVGVDQATFALALFLSADAKFSEGRILKGFVAGLVGDFGLVL
jgi:hypothetical protein